MAISLASLRTTSELQPPRILIHGVAGVGKSTFAADASAPVPKGTAPREGTANPEQSAEGAREPAKETAPAAARSRERPEQCVLDRLEGGVDQPVGKVLRDPGYCAREGLPAELARLQRVLDRPGDVIGQPSGDFLRALNSRPRSVPRLARNIGSTLQCAELSGNGLHHRRSRQRGRHLRPLCQPRDPAGMAVADGARTAGPAARAHGAVDL